jgi:isopenicillin N synthase-like dioxygenase
MGLPLARKLDFQQVPVIDFIALRNPDLAARRALAQEIAQVCADLGFFYIVNHGVPVSGVTDMFDCARDFFALPQSSRDAVALSKSTHYRGYIPLKVMSQKPQFEATKAELKGNLYEAFQIHAEFPADDPDVLAGKPLHTQNRWPVEMPSLKPRMLAYFDQLSVFALQMLKLFALGLDLPETALDRFFQKPMMQLRFIHYPPQPANDPGENLGLRPHTDSGAFTILAQDNIGGLEIQTRAGDWIEVPPIPNSYVINLGEMMKVWSDGTFQATPHRVINKYGAERYSVPFFATPNFDAPLQPLVQNPSDTKAPSYATAIDPTKNPTCGAHLIALYNRIWPVV